MQEVPPFPNNLPVAPLTKISYRKLLEQDSAESLALFDAAETHGIFQLNLCDGLGGLHLMDDVEKVFDIGKTFFDEDLETKKAYIVKRDGLGYKPIGAVAMGDGTRDLVELVGVPRDSVRDAGATPTLPAVFATSRALLETMSVRLHDVACVVLSHLAQHLDLPGSKLGTLHSEASASATAFRFLHHPPQREDGTRRASLLGHTDSGSLTILFAPLGGLQVLSPEDTDRDDDDDEEKKKKEKKAAEEKRDGDNSDERCWRWVRPEPGCAVVNLGDPLVQWSGGILRSAFHRVLYAPGRQAAYHRYAWGYFLKPADDASMARITDGLVIPRMSEQEEHNESDMPCYENWHRSKAAGYMAGRNDVKSFGGIRKRGATCKA